MKVLFAVSNDNITTSIVGKYQQKYKEIITSKNVYYFNAIIKELQRDKSYDAVVIGEDLEPFSNNDYEKVNKFLFEKLDSISDEAAKPSGEDIPIIFICTDRRTKADELLVKLFGIGIYNAIVGNDRSIDTVCNLIYKPRNKKEAKVYYQVESDDVDYRPEGRNAGLISETEIQNILNHFNKIGSNVKRCVESFDRIAEQYDETQLRVVIKFLPMNTKVILEEHSPKYQKLVMSGTVLTNGQYSQYNRINAKKPGKIDILEKDLKKTTMKKPVIIPSTMNFSAVNRPQVSAQPARPTMPNNPVSPMQPIRPVMPNNVASPVQPIRPVMPNNVISPVQPIRPVMPNNVVSPVQPIKPVMPNNMVSPVQPVKPAVTSEPVANRIEEKKVENINIENSDNAIPTPTAEVIQPVKRGRGRPKKIVAPVVDEVSKVEEITKPDVVQEVKRGRGRPKKIVTPVVDSVQNKFDDVDNTVSNAINETRDINSAEKKDFDNNINSVDTINSDANTSSPAVVDSNSTLPSVKGEARILNTPEPKKPMVQDFKFENPYTNAYSTLQNYREQKLQNPYADIEKNNSLNFGSFKPVTENNTSFEKPVNNFVNNNTSFEKPVNNFANNNTSFENPVNNFGNNNSKFENINNKFENVYNPSSNQIQKIEPERKKISSNFIMGNGKVVAFVGTSKNGTSFIINNLSMLLAQSGVRTAVIDLTKNKNAYYMFTNNDQRLTKIATDSMKNLEQGSLEGLEIIKNLTVYTELPSEFENEYDSGKIMTNASNNYDIVLLDCDFDTDENYFKNANELYLVQSMDAFTIQPLTKFLSNLKVKNILDENKLRIIINKYVKLKLLTDKMIIGGMSKYNEPSMSLQRDLFDSRMVKNLNIPFDVQTYEKYLESIAMCQISLSGYSQNFLYALQQLKEMVYPMIVTKNKKGNKSFIQTNYNYNNNNSNVQTGSFSNDINSTLNRMRNNNF